MLTDIVHKHVPYGISYDFIEKEMEVAIFLDRYENLPAECYFYKSTCLVPVVLLSNRFLLVEQYLEQKERGRAK